MKFFLVLLSLAALTYAGPVTFGKGKKVTIDDDGTITIVSDMGKRIVIYKAIGQPGPKDIEISIDGHEGLTKRIQIDGETNTKTVDLLDSELDNWNEEDRNKRSSKDTKVDSKSYKSKKNDGFAKLLKEFDGVVDATSLNSFMVKVNAAVESGEVNPAVYEVLKALNHYKQVEKFGYREPLKYRSYPSVQYPSANQQGEYFVPRDVRFPMDQEHLMTEQLQQPAVAVNPFFNYQQQRQFNPYVRPEIY